MLWNSWFKRVKAIHIGGVLRPTGRLELLRRPGPASVSDDATLQERAEIVDRQEGLVTGVRVADDRQVSGAAEVAADGSTILEVSGEPSKGEATVARVGQVLVAKLNALGANWSPPKLCHGEPARLERGVDCEASDGPNHLAIQVMRADSGQTFWRALSRIGRLRGRYTAHELADALRAAIAKKSSRTAIRDRAAITLALDATESMTHALAPAVSNFQQRHGSWASELGYSSIWVVGFDPALVHRLDVRSRAPDHAA